MQSRLGAPLAFARSIAPRLGTLLSSFMVDYESVREKECEDCRQAGKRIKLL
jgi:hypothetical protein